ncbi:MAG: hypothetical protein WCN88_04765 [Candidatus Falkowbacteria bacterium]
MEIKEIFDNAYKWLQRLTADLLLELRADKKDLITDNQQNAKKIIQGLMEIKSSIENKEEKDDSNIISKLDKVIEAINQKDEIIVELNIK